MSIALSMPHQSMARVNQGVGRVVANKTIQSLPLAELTLKVSQATWNGSWRVQQILPSFQTSCISIDIERHQQMNNLTDATGPISTPFGIKNRLQKLKKKTP